jgi:hypothetical protein
MSKSVLPLVAVSYLQTLANSNPRMVSEASNYFYALRDQYDNKKITETQYLSAITKFIEEQIRN